MAGLPLYFMAIPLRRSLALGMGAYKRRRRSLHAAVASATVWGAHASRMLVSASRRNELQFGFASRRLNRSFKRKFAIAGTRSPARQRRALPRRLLQRLTTISAASNP